MSDNKDIFDIVYDEVERVIIENKRMIATVLLFLIGCTIGNYLFGSDKEDCSDEIVQVDNAHCFNGSKLKHIDNQWICSCGK